MRPTPRPSRRAPMQAAASLVAGGVLCVVLVSPGAGTGSGELRATDDDRSRAEPATPVMDVRRTEVHPTAPRPSAVTADEATAPAESPPNVASTPVAPPASTAGRVEHTDAAPGDAAPESAPVSPAPAPSPAVTPVPAPSPGPSSEPAPSAPRSWAGRVFTMLHWPAPGTRSPATALWSMNHDGSDPRLEERGPVDDPDDYRYGIGDFDIARDGSLMVFTQEPPTQWHDAELSELWVRDVHNNRTLVAETDRYWGSVRLSPDGDRIAAERGIDVVVMDVDGSNVTVFPETARWDPGTPPTWSPDGTRIAVSTEYGLEVLEVANGERTKLTAGLCHPRSDWSPDGTYLVAAAFEGLDAGVHLIDVATGTATKVLDLPEHDGVASCMPLPPVRFSGNDTIMFARRVALNHFRLVELDLTTGVQRTVFDPGAIGWDRLSVTWG